MSIKLLGPIMLAILPIPQQSVQAYEDEDEYRSYVEERSYEESGGRFRAGAMADYLTPESEAIRDNCSEKVTRNYSMFFRISFRTSPESARLFPKSAASS